MKTIQPLVMTISLGISLLLAANVAMAEEKKSNASGGQQRGKSGSDAGKNEELAQYPLATRVPSVVKGAPSLLKLSNQMITDSQKNNDAEAQAAAEKIEKDPAANAYDRATAIQVKLYLVAKKNNDNHAAAIPLLEEAIASEGLSNNNHYAFMFQLAQRYLMDQDYQSALDTANKFIDETKSETKEILLIKGNSLYRLKKTQEAILVLEKVRLLDAADVQVIEMLASAYSDAGQMEKAAALTKIIGQATGNDRVAQINLAINYRDAKQYEKAADVIAKLRSAQQLVEERDYLTAMNIYSAMKNRENDMVAVVEEGLSKGVLKPTANNFNILAEAYYYSTLDDGVSKAIENWKKAAPISKNGATYLNLAIVQCQEEMWDACKESAKNAIEKGGINAIAAKAQITKADKGLGKAR